MTEETFHHTSSPQGQKPQEKAFSTPQRQSEIGVILIFLSTLYKFLRGFWAVGAYWLIARPSGKVWYMILVALGIIGFLVLLYSYQYYRKFLFYIDYEKRVFILKKGVFQSDQTEINFDKIQQVNTSQSLIQRLIGIYGLNIDTAGSKEDEIEIKAISKTRAHLLSEILMEEAGPSSAEYLEEVHSTEPTAQPPIWTYRHSFWTLFKIGISTNYFRGLFVMLAFFSTIYQDFATPWQEDYSGIVDGVVEEIPQQFQNLSFFLFIFLGLLILGFIITVIEVFVKYFNLNLKCTESRLEVEMGLKTSTKVTLQPRRVQLLRTSTNPVQKRLNLHQMNISLASSEDSFGKSKLKIPGLSVEILNKVNAFLFSGKNDSFSDIFRPHQLLLYRKLAYSFLPLLVFFFLWNIFEFISNEFFIGASIAYMLIIGFYQWLSFKSLKLEITDNFIIRKRGVWNQSEARLETYKLQSISVHRPFYYRKRKLVNLIFHTAGGDLPFSAVEERVLKYVDFALYKIESNDKKWM